MSQKTEKPTPKKLRDAQKKGQVAKSKEIAATTAIISLFAYFWIFFDDYVERSKYIIQAPAAYFDQPFDQALSSLSKHLFQEFALLSAPFILTAMAFTVLSYFVQIGLLVSFHPVKPDVKKINPVEGVKKMFSLNSLVELLKSVVKILLIGSIFWWLIRGHLQDMLNIFRGGQEGILALLGAITKKMAIAVSALFVCVSIIDHFLQKHLHTRNNKMTKDEVKREYKDREGDPQIKGRRRRLQMEMAGDDLESTVKDSSVVLIASWQETVVLRYVPGETPLPVISIKGKNIMAKKIFAAAKKFNIPAYRNHKVTRKLYAQCQQNDFIPDDLIDPIAEIFRDIKLHAEKNNPPEDVE